MKRFAVIIVAAACALSLTGCGGAKPSEEEVLEAIEAGSLTLQDAVDKGYVSQQWADDLVEEMSVPAASKTEAGAIGEFTTTTLAGEEFSREQMADVTLFAFLDPADSGAKAFFQALSDGYEGVRENGAEILVCTKGESGNEMFEGAPFPVIRYNDSLRDAVGTNEEMIEAVPNAASWCLNASFCSSWFSVADAEGLADDATSFVAMQRETANEGGSENDCV